VSPQEKDPLTVARQLEVWNQKEISSSKKSDFKTPIEVRLKTEGYWMRFQSFKSKLEKLMNLKLDAKL